VAEIAADIAGVRREEIERDTRLREDLNFDSLDVIEFVTDIEDAFDVTVPDDQAEQVRTVGEAADLLVKLRAG
jgi:acyl carrier protein